MATPNYIGANASRIILKGSSRMRDRLWHYLQNAKFKADYLCELSKRASTWGNIYSAFLALSSAGSVAAWAVWDQFPYVWAAIVALSQVLHVAKPYIPFLRYEKEYMELCFKYEFLFLKYEKLWFRYEKAAEDEECLEQEFYVHIPAHRDRPFRLNVTACSG
jgi:hypothetical protein